VQPRSTTVTADEALELLRIDKVDYANILRQFSAEMMAARLAFVQSIHGPSL
jgi:hypothetical protein